MRWGRAATIVPGNQGPGISPQWGAKGRESETERDDLPISALSRLAYALTTLVQRWAWKGMRESMLDIVLDSVICGTEQNLQGR